MNQLGECEIITFIVPTWNRPHNLDVAVRSIAEQIKDGCVILISDHGALPDTEATITRLCEDFPFVERRFCPRTEHADFSHNFKFAFGLAETPWTWTFGDDDMLLPGALDIVLSLCRSGKADFYHLSEEGRSTHTNKAIPGNLISLCNMLGWLDMTGFITGNVVRTKYIKQAVNSESWNLFAESAFPQALCLLETLADRPSAFIDGKFIACQHPGDPVSIQHWGEQRIAQRYNNVIDGIEYIADLGIIPRTLKNPFFRYHSYYLWDRLIGHMIEDYLYAVTPANWERWEYIERFSKFLDDESRVILDTEIQLVKTALMDHQSTFLKLKKDSELVDAFHARHNMERFPFNYLPDKDAETEALIIRSGIIGALH